MTRRTWLFAIPVLLSVPLTAAELRVMTYNIRLPSKSDGANYWENRKQVAVEMLRRYDPDLFGTQELFYEQGEYLAAQLPDYRWFGRSRRGNHEDEHMGVFYKPAKLELLEKGDFWLSETPDEPGSMSWNVSLPRMVTWGRFRLKETGTEFYFLNTHFPHRRQDAEARVKCAEVIVRFLTKLPAGIPVVLTGDFNDPAGGKVYALLTGKLRDARAAAAKKAGPEGTFHGFTGKPGEARIDWILFRAPWKVIRAETVTFHSGELYPSDHFPVLAVFRLAE